MPTKTSGAEFKRFYADETIWPEGTWHDDVIFTVNGEDPGDFDMATVADTDMVTMEGGVVQGGPYDGKEPSIETLFKRWLKKQNTVTLAIEFDASLRDQVLTALKSAGAKVIC